MGAKEDQKAFEEALGRNRQHTNKQTFTADSSVAIFEVIDTPGVDIAGKVGCLITAVAVMMDFAVAHATAFNDWRTQILGGQQNGLLMPDSPKYVAEVRMYAAGMAGTQLKTMWPLAFVNPTKPMLIVNPHMTILHVTSNMVDAAGDDVYTMFSYQLVALTIEMHTSLMHAQMDLT